MSQYKSAHLHLRSMRWNRDSRRRTSAVPPLDEPEHDDASNDPPRISLLDAIKVQIVSPPEHVREKCPDSVNTPETAESSTGGDELCGMGCINVIQSSLDSGGDSIVERQMKGLRHAFHYDPTPPTRRSRKTATGVTTTPCTLDYTNTHLMLSSSDGRSNHLESSHCGVPRENDCRDTIGNAPMMPIDEPRNKLQSGILAFDGTNHHLMPPSKLTMERTRPTIASSSPTPSDEQQPNHRSRISTSNGRNNHIIQSPRHTTDTSRSKHSPNRHTSRSRMSTSDGTRLLLTARHTAEMDRGAMTSSTQSPSLEPRIKHNHEAPPTKSTTKDARDTIESPTTPIIEPRNESRPRSSPSDGRHNHITLATKPTATFDRDTMTPSPPTPIIELRNRSRSRIPPSDGMNHRIIQIASTSTEDARNPSRSKTSSPDNHAIPATMHGSPESMPISPNHRIRIQARSKMSPSAGRQNHRTSPERRTTDAATVSQSPTRKPRDHSRSRKSTDVNDNHVDVEYSPLSPTRKLRGKYKSRMPPDVNDNHQDVESSPLSTRNLRDNSRSRNSTDRSNGQIIADERNATEDVRDTIASSPFEGNDNHLILTDRLTMEDTIASSPPTPIIKNTTSPFTRRAYPLTHRGAATGHDSLLRGKTAEQSSAPINNAANKPAEPPEEMHKARSISSGRLGPLHRALSPLSIPKIHHVNRFFRYGRREKENEPNVEPTRDGRPDPPEIKQTPRETDRRLEPRRSRERPMDRGQTDSEKREAFMIHTLEPLRKSPSTNTANTTRIWDGIEESTIDRLTVPNGNLDCNEVGHEAGLLGDPEKFNNMTERDFVIVKKLNEKNKDLQDFFKVHRSEEKVQEKPTRLPKMAAIPSESDCTSNAFSLHLALKEGVFDDSDISALAMGDSATIYHLRAAVEGKMISGDYWKQKYERLKEETKRVMQLRVEEEEEELDDESPDCVTPVEIMKRNLQKRAVDEKLVQVDDEASRLVQQQSSLLRCGYVGGKKANVSSTSTGIVRGVEGRNTAEPRSLFERSRCTARVLPEDNSHLPFDQPDRPVQAIEEDIFESGKRQSIAPSGELIGLGLPNPNAGHRQTTILQCGYGGGKKAKDAALRVDDVTNPEAKYLSRTLCLSRADVFPEDDHRLTSHRLDDDKPVDTACSLVKDMSEEIVVSVLRSNGDSFDAKGNEINLQAELSSGSDSLNTDGMKLRQIGFVRAETPSTLKSLRNFRDTQDCFDKSDNMNYIIDDKEALRKWNNGKPSKALADELSAGASRAIASKISSAEESELSEDAKLIFEAALKYDMDSLCARRSLSTSRQKSRNVVTTEQLASPVISRISSTTAATSILSSHFASTIPNDFADWFELPSPGSLCVPLIPTLNSDLKSFVIVELLDVTSENIDVDTANRITPRHRVHDVVTKSLDMFVNSSHPSHGGAEGDDDYMGPIVADGDNGSIRFANAFIHLGGISDAAMAHMKKYEFQDAIDIYMTLLRSCQSSSQTGLVGRLIASTLHNLGVLHFWTEEFDLALSFSRKCLKLKTNLLGDSVSTVHALANLGMIHYAMESVTCALSSFQNAVQILDMISVEYESSLFGRLVNNIACLNAEFGKLDLAHSELKRSLRLQKQTSASTTKPKPCDMDALLLISQTIFNLGVVCVRQKRYIEAHTHVNACNAMQEALLGQHNVQVENTSFYLELIKKAITTTESNYASTEVRTMPVQLQSNDYILEGDDKGFKIVDLREVYDHPFSTKSNEISYPLISLGNLKLEATAAERVRECLDRCSNRMIKSDDPNHASIGKHPSLQLLCKNPPIMINHTRKLMNFGLKTLQKREMQAELQDNLERYGPRHPLVAQSHHNLGLMLLHIENYRESINHFEQAVRINTNALGVNHPDITSSLMFAGLALLALERFEDAMAYMLRVRRTRANALGDRHPEICQIMNNLACVHFELGDHKRAESMLQEALDMQRELFHTEPGFLKGVSTILCNIAFVHAKIGSFPKALIELEGALQIRQNILFEDASTGDITENMAYILAIHHLQHGSGNIDDITKEYIDMLRKS